MKVKSVKIGTDVVEVSDSEIIRATTSLLLTRLDVSSTAYLHKGDIVYDHDLNDTEGHTTRIEKTVIRPATSIDLALFMAIRIIQGLQKGGYSRMDTAILADMAEGVCQRKGPYLPD